MLGAASTKVKGLLVSRGQSVLPGFKSSFLLMLPGLPVAWTALSAAKARFTREVKHCVPQQPIRLGLIATTPRLEPCDHVGVQSHGHRLLLWPIELSNFRPAPIENGRRVREINVFVSFCGDGSDVPLLFLCELLHRLSFPAIRRHEPRSGE